MMLSPFTMESKLKLIKNKLFSILIIELMSFLENFGRNSLAKATFLISYHPIDSIHLCNEKNILVQGNQYPKETGRNSLKKD